MFYNPNLITIPLDNGFTSLVNPFIPNGIRIINALQYKVLEACSKYAVDEVAKIFAICPDKLEDFLQKMIVRGFISFNDKFQTEINPLHKNESLDFWIHVTDSCNMNCRYCFITTKGTQQDFDIKQLPSLIDTLKLYIMAHDVKKISIRYSGGECLLKFDLLQQIHQYFKELDDFANLKFYLLTNLTIINNDILDFIIKDKITVSTSLDGINYNSNLARVKNLPISKHLNIVNNIEKIRSKGIDPIVQTVVTISNMESLEETILYYVENRIKHRIGFVHGESLDYEKLCNILERVYIKIESKILSGYEFSKYHVLGELKFLHQNCFNCAAGVNSFMIYVNGDIYYCPQELGRAFPRGNIKENKSLWAIMNNYSFQRQNINSDCKKCQYRNICCSGCPLERINGKSVACELNKKIIPIVYRLLSLEKMYHILNK